MLFWHQQDFYKAIARRICIHLKESFFVQDAMPKRSQQVFKWLSLDRLGTMHKHYLSIRDELAPRSTKEREESDFFSQAFEDYYNRAAFLGKIRWLLYLFLYATVAINVLKLIPILRYLVGFIELGSALVGTGIAFVLIFLLTARINLHMQRMQQCLSHLIVLYHLNSRRDSARALENISTVI
jgi:hypothetical protein